MISLKYFTSSYYTWIIAAYVHILLYHSYLTKIKCVQSLYNSMCRKASSPHSWGVILEQQPQSRPRKTKTVLNVSAHILVGVGHHPWAVFLPPDVEACVNHHPKDVHCPQENWEKTKHLQHREINIGSKYNYYSWAVYSLMQTLPPMVNGWDWLR